MIPSLSIGPRTLLNDCNHSATAIFWRSAIQAYVDHMYLFEQNFRTLPSVSTTMLVQDASGM